MKWLTFVPAALLSVSLCAQRPVTKPNPYASIDALALKLPDSSSATVAQMAGYINAHFTTPTEKTRAIFIWIANNIQYDVVNMFALNFYDDPVENINRPLRTRKGICVNYASLFTDSRIQPSLQQLKDAIAQAEPHFKETQAWLQKYFGKGKLGRRSMFYKFSWMGVPLN